jgi:uncharacterized coiled-coil DUF342 family protein
MNNERLQNNIKPDIDGIIFDIQSSYVEATEFVNQYFEMKAEIERLQAEIEQNKTWHKRDYEALCQEQNKVERLEKALKEIAENPYNLREVLVRIAKQALEKEGKV